MSNNNSNICVVPGCNNVESNDITLHEFPLTNYDLSLKWLNAIKLENWVPSRDSKVCSKHFRQTDLIRANGLKAKLKNNAVPCFNLFLHITHEPKQPEVVEEKCTYHVTIPPDGHFCCVWGCTINSVKQPKNAFHLLPINHQLTICDCIGLRVPIDPVEFLSKSLEICDQHYKQNAMLLYINTEITSDGPSAKTKLIKETPPVFPPKSSTTNKNAVTIDETPIVIDDDSDCEIILNEDDLLHFDFSLNAKQSKNVKKAKTPPTDIGGNKENISILEKCLTKEDKVGFYDIDNICRICLHGGDLIQIYGKTYNNVFISEMVGSCINLHNTIEKKFPQKICKKCLITLRTVYNFLTECKRSTNILDKFVKQQKDNALQSLHYDHDYNKAPPKTKINLQELMENAGINVLDTFGTNEIEASITEPDEVLNDTIPPDVIQKIKNTKINEYSRKIPKKVLDTIQEKADLNIGGKKFILAKAFTCKKCKEICFSQESFNEHMNVCNFKPDEQSNYNYKKCKKCSKLFKNEYQEITHQCLKRRRRDPLKCYKCSTRFKCLSFYANHKCDPNKLKRIEKARALNKTRIKYRRCKTCKEGFLTQKELTSHIKENHPETITVKTPSCVSCQLVFKTRDELLTHRKESHGVNRIVTCPTCMKQMTASQYTNHKLIHNLERRFCCEFCGKRFKSSTNFRSHVDKVHLNLKPYVCDICGRAYNTRTKMMDHRNVHLGIKKYMCDACGARFTYKSCLASHISKKRCGKTKGLAKEHQCPNCNEVVRSRRLLIQHRREAHGIKKGANASKTYTCEVCKIPCESAADLRTHEVIHGEKKYVCDQQNCRRPFFTAERLQRHIRVHEQINVQCAICEKGFYSKLSLNMHMKTHTGEKNYHCSYCPKQFTQQGHLIAHTRTHTGAKPYQCPYCSRAFAMNGNLTVHIRTHTGQRPYECNYCDQAFFDASSRKRHMVQKHGYGLSFELLNEEVDSN